MLDPELQLSSSTLAALQEFLGEEKERREHFEALAADAERRQQSGIAVDISKFQENWQLSQFWFNDNTARTVCDELLEGADENTTIAIISAPSVYCYLKKRESLPTNNIYLLEFDDRFRVIGGDKFIRYDYNQPLDVPTELKNKVDRVLVDPPFLNPDCQTKASITARFLLKSDHSAVSKHNVLQYRTMVCTGERMTDLVAKLYPDTHMTKFHPEHTNGLSNEYRCYTSYESPRLESPKV
ncbi:protein-lysine N-methyltransferase Efm5p [Trichomonascus vanleenenianus]|uniref:protein-lysine N-methyltransferase n=1 Tax=Trichomonascus vanleenenianus TaxID=2268995 RepID=UPI003ECA2D20